MHAPPPHRSPSADEAYLGETLAAAASRCKLSILLCVGEAHAFAPPLPLIPSDVNHAQGKVGRYPSPGPSEVVHSPSFRSDAFTGRLLSMLASTRPPLPSPRSDAFTGRLLSMLASTRAARQALAGGELVLGVNRSDYMLDAPSGGFLQVRAEEGGGDCRALAGSGCGLFWKHAFCR